jgi:hypothetical protein
MRPGGDGRVRKGLATLLVLVLLALSAIPAAAWPVPATGQADRHDAATGCGSHDPGAVPRPPDQEPSRGHHDHVPPALACCAALHCPMLLADLQPALAALVPSEGLPVRAAVATRQPAGLDIAPTLPPPRYAV